ncbi:diacylglycerol/lipid kinase family protein [Wenjunlia vitaminophila]|uniref:diacylglycerol/lipid kinase family protein n=1 Tax=Wenjunlia vitaminophila TaxID=76728 RepID=UPI000365B849|nr:diacylglycerol kinase family protein [Wenjunlia vitaminophila]
MPQGRWAGFALLIANPAAGGRSPELIDAVAAHCAERVSVLDVVRTGYPGHASEIAAKAMDERVDLVISFGGDGTTREVASGLARAAQARPGLAVPPLLHLPGGTGNSFYREVWSDQPWQRTVDAALLADRPSLRRVDLAHIVDADDFALLGAGSGLIAEALVTAARIAGESHGRDRYQQSVALTLRDFAPYPGRVSVDGRTVHEGTVILANVGGGRYRGGQFKVLPHSVLDDGLLDVCVIGGELSLRDLPGLTRDGSHVHRPEVVYARGRSIVLERTDGNPLTFEYDGELQTGSAQRHTVEVMPGVLPVLAPPAARPGGE